MTRLWPSVIVVVGYLVCFYFLALCVRRIPIGVAYGIWSGLGMALVAGLGMLCFGERLDWRRIGGLALIGAGVALVNQD